MSVLSSIPLITLSATYAFLCLSLVLSSRHFKIIEISFLLIKVSIDQENTNSSLEIQVLPPREIILRILPSQQDPSRHTYVYSYIRKCARVYYTELLRMWQNYNVLVDKFEQMVSISFNHCHVPPPCTVVHVDTECSPGSFCPALTFLG